LDELFERPYGSEAVRALLSAGISANVSSESITHPGWSNRLFGKPQQAKDEAYVGWYVEKLSEARTQPTACFTSL
jgi:hypothetical protein